MKKTIMIIAGLCLCAGASAQSIGESELAAIRGSFVKDAATVAKQNALMNTLDIASLAVNQAKAGKLDDNFKYEVKALPSAPNQFNSGRCWLFTSLNSLRQWAIDKYDVKDFRFSNVYDSFWDLFEKSNVFLENAIATAGMDIDEREPSTYFKTPVGDGGIGNWMMDLGEKYGVVPESVMPETIHSNNTANMRTILNLKLRKEGWALREKAAKGESLESLRAYKLEVMKDVYRILALCEGEPPTEFTWTYTDRKGNVHKLKTTPKEFYKSIVPADYNLQERIMVMSDPTRPYYRIYEVKGYQDMVEGSSWTYLNLPFDEVKAACLAKIKAGEAIYISCDWRKEQLIKDGKATMSFDNYDYESLFDMDFRMDQKSMILSRYTSSAHAMLITACDTDENDRPLKWKLFNSYMVGGVPTTLVMSDEWFENYMYRFLLDKKYLSAKAVSVLGSEVTVVPAWDYMK